MTISCTMVSNLRKVDNNVASRCRPTININYCHMYVKEVKERTVIISSFPAVLLTHIASPESLMDKKQLLQPSNASCS